MKSCLKLLLICLFSILLFILLLNVYAGNSSSNIDTSFNEKEADKFIPSPIVLFSIPDDDLKPPIKELPYYGGEGNVSVQQLPTYQEWDKSGGHMAWRTDPYSVLSLNTANLVPENISTRENMLQDFTVSGNTAKNKDGVIIKLVDPKNTSIEHNPSHATKLTYKMIVPHLGSYDITVQQPQGLADFIITKIVFNPNSSD